MSPVVLDADTIARIRVPGPEVVFVAENGTVIGRMHVESTKTDGLWYTPEERTRRMSGTGRPVAEILRDLRTKYGD